MVNVDEGVDLEVLLFVDKALSELVYLLHRWIPAGLQKLDELPRSDLSLLDDPLFVLVEPDLVVVDE
jgi:hypothetical protein